MKNSLIIATLVLLTSVLVPHPIAYGQADSEAQKTKKKAEDLFEMSFEDLMKIEIITAAKTPEKIGGVPASVVIVTRRDIERHGYSTLSEILENIPGLYGIEDYSSQGANFGVRGFWSGVPNDNIMILVNGIHQLFDLYSNYPIGNSPIPVEAIDRIDVIRGPMSVVYGSGAFFGVINIITNSDLGESHSDPLNIVSASVGSLNNRNVFLRLEGSEGKLRYTLNGAFTANDGIDEPLSKMMTDANALAFFNLQPDHRTGGQLELNRKYLNFSGKYGGLGVDFTFVQGNQELYFLMPSATRGHMNRLTVFRAALSYRTQVNEKLALAGKFNYAYIRDNYRMNFLFDDFFGSQQLSSDALEAELNLFYSPSSQWDITAGLYYRSVLDISNNYHIPGFGAPSLMNNSFKLADEDNIITRAVYTQVTYKPLKQLQLVAGLRAEQMPRYTLEAIRGGLGNFETTTADFDVDDVELIPRIAMIWFISPRHIIKLLYGEGINRSSFLQNQQNNLADGIDPLKPEHINTIELNYIAALSDHITLNASIFHNVLENLVTREVEEFDPNDPNKDYKTWSANAGRMITNGVELSLLARFSQGLKLELSATMQNTEDKRDDFSDIDVAYSPDFLGYIKASYETDTFSIAFTGNYVDKMQTFFEEIPNSPQFEGRRIGQPVPGYFNLSGNIRFDDLFIKGLYMRLRVTNILDTEIRYPTFTNNQWADRGTLGAGRAWLVSLGYKF